MNKGKHIQKLAQRVVDLQDELYFRDRVYATKIKAVAAIGQMVEKVLENGSDAAKQFWGSRLMSVNSLLDLTDALMGEVEELKMVNDYLIDLNQKLQQRVKEDEALIDKLLNEKMWK